MPTLVTPSDQRTSRTGAATQSTAIDTSPPTSSAMRNYRYRAQYADVQDHLLSVERWTQQLTEKLWSSSIDYEDRPRISQALSLLRRLQQQCFEFRDLLVACDPTLRELEPFTPNDRTTPPKSSPARDLLFKEGNSDTFEPIPDHLRARPSAFSPPCIHVSPAESPLSQNYYHLLSTESTDTSIDAPTQRTIFKKQLAPPPVLKNSLDELIKEFTDKDLPKECRRTSGLENRTPFSIRFSLRLGKFRDPAFSRDTFATAFTSLNTPDSSFGMLPSRNKDIMKLLPPFQSLYAGPDPAMGLAAEAIATKAKDASTFFEALEDGEATAILSDQKPSIRTSTFWKEDLSTVPPLLSGQHYLHCDRVPSQICSI